MTAAVAEAAPAPSMVGRPVQDLDTPALLIDLDTMEANIQRMASYCARYRVNWRPHTKGIKVPEIAKQELAAGAFGITCAKLGEAEAMAAAGIDNILVANQIVGPIKVGRLVELSKTATVLVAVDSMANAQAMSEAAREVGVRVKVLIEVDGGMNRCGVDPGQPTVAFAQQVHELPGLELQGVMAWEGHTAGMSDMAEKRPAVKAAVGVLTDTADQVRAAGLPCKIVSCGGTGTYQITATLPGVTEIQAGGGIFGDLTYQSWGVDHRGGLSVLGTVVSRPTPDRIVTDTGFKALGWQRVSSLPKALDSVDDVRLSAEHCRITLGAANNSVRVGDKIELIASYGDATVFLHDELHGVRNGVVETVWPVFPRSRYR